MAAIQERGVRVTRSARPRECLDLFGRRPWRFLIVNAGGDIPSALDVLARAREARPDIPALMLVRRGDVGTTVQAMKAGAVNCLETPIQPGGLLAVVAPLCGAPDPESDEPWLPLTHVERTVLWHMLAGRTNRQIAGALCRSPRTIEVHRRHVMVKLHAANLIDLVRQAMKVGMLDSSGSQIAGAHLPAARTCAASRRRAKKRSRRFPIRVRLHGDGLRFPMRTAGLGVLRWAPYGNRLFWNARSANARPGTGKQIRRVIAIAPLTALYTEPTGSRYTRRRQCSPGAEGEKTVSIR